VPTAALREAVSDLLAHTLGGLVEIDWHTAKDAWNVFADRAQLELAIVNLIINARDAMPAGGTATVSIENRAAGREQPAGLPPGDHVLISVTDNGTGIAPNDLERVMDPFFTTKEMGKGSGLGLSMVYGFAQQSNGAFRIESELGRGTRAELWLPRAPAGSPADSRPSADEARIDSPGPLKILLVDDHEEVRTTTGAMLEELGHTVTGAANGRDALQALRDRDCDYDLMISDYAMPHVSGTEFLREAREMCPGVPALIITGYAEVEAIADRPENVEVLPKPFTPKALEAAIARICAPAAVAG
jgi:CheY-like chemotaxis protein